jgi:hypothetical protein
VRPEAHRAVEARRRQSRKVSLAEEPDSLGELRAGKGERRFKRRR